MQNNTLGSKSPLLIVVFCFIVVAALAIWYGVKSSNPVPVEGSVPVSGTSSPLEQAKEDLPPNKIEVSKLSDGSEATFSYEPAKLPYTPPSLDRKLVPPEGTSLEVASTTLARVSALVVKLKKEPGDAGVWLSLGLYRADWKDYEGATEAWKFAAALAPKDSRGPLNLANMNAYYLKDFATAETYYLEAAKREPIEISIYIRMFEFYRDVVKDMAKAKAIIKKGLVANPGDKDLKAMLDGFSQ